MEIYHGKNLKIHALNKQTKMKVVGSKGSHLSFSQFTGRDGETLGTE